MTDRRSMADDLVLEALRSLRSLLAMDVAFVSEFRDGRRVFRHVDSGDASIPVGVGASDALEDSYCQRIVDGRLPGLMQDARAVPEALRLRATREIPVGAHLSVPIRLDDGRIYGTLCCFSRAGNSGLGQRDLEIVRCFADMASRFIQEQAAHERKERELQALHREVLAAQRFHIVYQPIVQVADRRVVGYEALARFVDPPARPPDQWFREAERIGMQTPLEVGVMRKALQALELVPASVYVSINASPRTILEGGIDSLFDGEDCARVLLELTEHSSDDDYAVIARVLAPLRRRGLRIAVDDAGAGYASFRHILKLRPDVIKLDNSLIRQVDSDRGYRALAAALVRFAEETGSEVVAEGVETQAELQVLEELEVGHAQGYLLGRPAPLERYVA